ncbi:MAG: hypothetical protein ACP5GZ_01765 [Vulcanisaeta sp.]|uniref:hypothetical protein n=1 Tax=Vulcanisaeta sp. TaxID=2020871 RepID=UPI003D11CF01
MRKLFLIIMILVMALIALASAVYYKYVTTSINVTNPPISIEQAQSQYISNFINRPTGLYISASISKSVIIYVNNTGTINITLARVIITRPIAVELNINAQEPVQLTLMILNASNALVAMYPNDTIFNLNPGNYIIIEEIRLPMNFTGMTTVSGTYIVMIKGVEFVYNLNEDINITN